MKSDGGEVILHYILYYVHDLINNWEFINLQWILQRNKKKQQPKNQCQFIFTIYFVSKQKKG